MVKKKKGKKVKKKGKKRMAKKLRLEEQHKKYVHQYNEEIALLQSKLENLEVRVNDASTTSEKLLEERNSTRRRYEATVRDKDDVLNFLTGHLQHLMDKNQSFVYRKGEVQKKTAQQIASFRIRLYEVRGAAEEIGQRLAMDQIVLRSKIATLDHLKGFQKNLIENVTTAEIALQERNQTMTKTVQTRNKGHNRILFDLRNKSEKLAKIFQKEAQKGYYLSRITNFREHLKNNLKSRILFRKFIDASFALYQRFLHLLQLKFNLNQELQFLDYVKSKLSRECSRQEQEMRYLEEENENLERELKRVEDKQLQLQELRERCAELRSEIQALKERDLRIRQDIKSLSKEAEEESLMCVVLKKRCSELICILKSTEEVVRVEMKEWREPPANLPRGTMAMLKQELLDFLDTSQYENVCSYKSQIRHGVETRPFPISLGIPTNSKHLKATKSHEIHHKGKIEADLSTRETLGVFEARILSQLGIYRMSCKHSKK